MSKMIQKHSAREPTHDFSVVSVKMENSPSLEETSTNHRKRNVILTSKDQLLK